ncbi:unnamed protein product [Sphenostylis stenocarpa]|uniref:Uncharacterized protein n=1 Tax=Sphenostylis stenocarpa TaxID=92480 RepID=A0AA86VIY1_9FABA|nr:unnamed protein product [Sphenostylis stenocarpa]
MKETTPSNGLLKPAEDMGFSLEFIKSISKQNSNLKTDKEKRSLKEADKLKSKSGAGTQCSDLKQKSKLDTGRKIQKAETVRRETERDELVKHMSNLPGYLQRANRVENFQEKAFNVGVLDWSRLEKWKQKHIPVLASNFISFSSSESSSRRAIKPSTSVGSKEKLNDEKNLPSGTRSSYRESERAKLPFHDVKRFKSSRSVTKSAGDEKRMTPQVYESSGKTHSDISLGKEKRNDYSSKRTSQVKSFASNTRLHGISSVRNENANDMDDGGKQNMEGLQEHNHKKKERNRKSSSDTGLPSVKSKGKGVSSSSKKMSSSSSENERKVNQLQESDNDIVLLCPQEIPQSSSSEDFQLSESRMSSDENFSESSKSSLSYVSLPEEVYTEDRCSKIPLSGPLRSAVEPSSPLETMPHSISTDLGIDRSSFMSETPSSIIDKMSSLQSAGAGFEKDMLDAKLRDECAFSNLKESLDQETAELTAQKEMNPSHNRRFSFSLSRIGRSFSFKEGPTLPQYSSMYVSAKSGPVTPQSSVRWDNPSKERANSHNRNRSSPLRRLLDPLLKHKVSDKHHSAQSGQTLEGSVNSSFRTVGVNESLLPEKSKGSSVQGLLQLTIKNGVPLFKFVLNNERKIFAATRNSLTSLDKSCCFTFYLVNEIKKKSGGWISHGNKEKNCGYAYNVIAQMKISISKNTDLADQYSNKKHMAKEYVLVGVEIGHTDQGPPKFIQSAELAAVVIETSFENSNEGLDDDNYMPKKGCSKCLADERCICNSGQHDASDCTTVILPGGVHGSPNKGEPTPLIYRWKSGGSCDCGGWDIGCKLLVLSNQKQNSSIPKNYQPYHDRFQLFVQEGAEQDTPLFTLLPLKDGFYSVEFDSTITHLQAFFMSVAVLSSQKLPGAMEMDGIHEEILKEPSSKNNSKLHGKAPLKYAPMPPLSPVGRV